MKLQPNLKYNDELKTIEQPYQLSNRMFDVLSNKNKATLSEYSEKMDHREVFRDMIENNKDKEFSLNRVIYIKKEKYDMEIKGASLCVDIDLRIFWHLLNRKLESDSITIENLCKELDYNNYRDSKTHKTIIESFYRLSNNNITIVTENSTLVFKLVSYKKEDNIIKYSFNEDFLKLVNSKNGLERYNIITLKDLKYGVSKLLYTMLVRNKYKKDGSREFKCDELIKVLGLKHKKASKSKESIKSALQELKDNKIIGDFTMKLNNIVIKDVYSVLREESNNKAIIHKEELKNDVEDYRHELFIDEDPEILNPFKK